NMIFFRKLRRYGVKRGFVYFLILLICKIKVLFYRFFLSDNDPDVQESRILQPTQFVGKGRIKIKGASLGVWPSPGLLGQSGYIEARSADAVVEISSLTFLN